MKSTATVMAASSADAPYNKSLDASGGSVFCNLLGAAEGALIRAAASTQTLAVFSHGDNNG
jgi:hypothetical protein